MRTLHTGSGLLIGHARRHGGKRTVLGNRHVLGMSTERTLVVPEHSVAGLKRRDAAADSLDHSGELIAQDRRSWPGEPGEESHEEGLGSPAGAVSPVHGCRVDLDEHLVVLDSRLLHF